MQETVTAVETEAEDLRQKLSQVAADARELRAARAKLHLETESELSRREQELSRLLAEKDAALQTYLREAKGRAEHAREDIEGLKAKIALRDEELARVREDWSKERGEAAELLERGRADAESAMRDLEILERHATEAAEEADKKLREASEKQRVEADEALEGLRLRRDREAERLRQEAGICRSEAVALREQMEQRGKEADLLREQLEGRQREADVLGKQLEKWRREAEERGEEAKQRRREVEQRGKETDALRERLEQQRNGAERLSKDAEELRALLEARQATVAEEAQRARETLERTRRGEDLELRRKLESQHKSEIDAVRDELQRLRHQRMEETERLRATLGLMESEAGEMRGNLEKGRVEAADGLRQARESHAADMASTQEEFERQMAEVAAAAEAKLRDAVELRKSEATTAGKQLRALGRYCIVVRSLRENVGIGPGL